MEIDITQFFENAAPMDYSASIAELGPSAACAFLNATDERESW